MGYGSAYLPDYLMDNNVIFVSSNWRLGLFGKFSNVFRFIKENWNKFSLLGLPQI